MGRMFFCLPLCLLLAPIYPITMAPITEDAPFHVALSQDVSHDLFAALTAVPQSSFPGALPWTTVWRTYSRLPDPDPVAFLQKCLQRYEREVTSYSLTFRKRERIKGNLNPQEEILVHYQDQPHSVYFQWKDGANRASRVLFVAGENDGKMIVRAMLGGWILTKDVAGEEAKNSGRLTLDQFGMKQGLERVLNRFIAAKHKNALFLDYLGVFQIPEVGDRRCYVFHRSNYAEPEDDGVTDLVLYIDLETWLMVGTVARGRVTDNDGNVLDNEFIAAYYFRDIRLNPQFRENQFQRSALSQ